MEAIAIIIVRGLGMVLLIAGGIACLHYGFRLYRRRTGSHSDLAEFEVGPVRISAHSVGSIVMATAFLWAWAGVTVCPSLEKRNGVTVVTSGFVWAPTDAPSASAVEQDPDRLQSLFRDAIKSQSGGQDGALQVDGQPAQYDPASVKIRPTEPGKYAATVMAQSGSSSVELEFKPQMVGGRLAFVPAAAAKSGPSTRTLRPKAGTRSGSFEGKSDLRSRPDRKSVHPDMKKSIP